jgi:hypothetical protein
MKKRLMVITACILFVLAAVLFLSIMSIRFRTNHDTFQKTPPRLKTSAETNVPLAQTQEAATSSLWVLLEPTPDISIGSSTYIVHNDQVYAYFPADPGSFTVYAPGLYAKDQNFVYCGNRGLVYPGPANPGQFSVIAFNKGKSLVYATDGKILYNGCHAVHGDPEGYSSYYPENIIDPASFTLIGGIRERRNVRAANSGKGGMTAFLGASARTSRVLTMQKSRPEAALAFSILTSKDGTSTDTDRNA